MIRNTSHLKNEVFDILIIGGGIYGATLAWMASLSGFRTAIIEQNDFASGTSANSQKIIHGGLRYLQNFDFKRIADSVKERKRLMWLAPHLVKPLPMVMPVYGHGFKGKEAITAGMYLYNLLSISRNSLPDKEKYIPNARFISKKETEKLIPDLNCNNLMGAALWYDAFCSNTERLVLSFIKSAVSFGTVAANYVKATRLITKDKKAVGVEAFCKIDSENFEIRAKNVVNCTGASINEFSSTSKNNINYIAGINLVVNRALPIKCGVGLNDPKSGRMYVVVPWKNKFIIGTEWFHTNDLKKFVITNTQINQLIDSFNNAYPAADIDSSDVTFIHQGFVPAKEKHPDQAMTEFKILDRSSHGLYNFYSIVGVKYTTAADAAEKIIKKIYHYFQKYPLKNQPKLIGGEISSMKDFKNGIIEKWKHLFPITVLENLISEYGSEVENILKVAQSNFNNHFFSEHIIRAQVLYSIKEEMACSLEDIVSRRTSLGSHEKPSNDTLNYISIIAAEELKWSSRKRTSEIDGIKQKYTKESTIMDWSN